MSASKTMFGEHIRTEITTSDSRIGNGLNDRPPLGVKQHRLAQPIADQLLAGLQVATGLGQNSPKSVSEGSLVSAGNLDGPPQRGNVCSLHEYRNNTNRFVFSTNPFVRQEDKGVCTVLDMASRSAALKRPVAAPKPPKKKRKALPGPDGKTLGQRVSEAMAYKSGRLGQDYRAADLLRDVAKLSPPGDTILTQQMLSAILRNTVTQTSKTPFIAMACGVSAVWLSNGIGKMTD
jgi:hypothetical protein